MNNLEPRLGVSLFSFTNEWRMGLYNLESLMARLASSPVGAGVEIIGTQSIKGYPRLSEEFVLDFRRMLDKHQRIPICMGAGTDVLRRRAAPMDEAEIVADLIAQIDVARRLGFPVVRIQLGLTQRILERLASAAERMQVKLGMEIHAPQGGETPAVQELRQIYGRIGSANLGFIPDFSSTMHAVPKGQLRAFVNQGLPVSLATLLVECWTRDDLDITGRFREFQRAAHDAGVDPQLVTDIRIMFFMFGRQPVDSWVPLMDQVFHVHAKFYEIDAAGDEPSIRYDELMPLFRKHGYQGWFASEWEGTAFTLTCEVDAMDIVESQHALMRRTWAAV